MMGVSHAYSGIAFGCAVASVGLPHGTTLLEVSGRITAAGSGGNVGVLVLAWIVAFVFLVVFSTLLPGFLLPDPLLPNPPLLVLLLLVLIVGGCALMPDLDHPSSTVARTLGPITHLISIGLAKLSLTLYHASRLDGDNPDKASGHRLITHTWPGSAGFALIALVCQAVHPIASGVVVGISAGLLATGIRHLLGKILRMLPRFLRIVGTFPGFTIGSASGVAAWHCSETYSGWSYLFPLAVFLGCVIHREGDWCTNSGVPRRLWGIPEEGGTKRWKKHGAPRRFDTGKDEERFVVRPVLLGGVVAATAGMLTMPAVLPALLVAGGS